MNPEEIEAHVEKKVREKKSFCLSKDLRSFFDFMTPEQTQWLMKAIFAYADGQPVRDPKEARIPPVVAAALTMAMKSIDENNERYAEQVRNGKLGSAKRWGK